MINVRSTVSRLQTCTRQTAVIAGGMRSCLPQSAPSPLSHRALVLFAVDTIPFTPNNFFVLWKICDIARDLAKILVLTLHRRVCLRLTASRLPR